MCSIWHFFTVGLEHSFSALAVGQECWRANPAWRADGHARAKNVNHLPLLYTGGFLASLPTLWERFPCIPALNVFLVRMNRSQQFHIRGNLLRNYKSLRNPNKQTNKQTPKKIHESHKWNPSWFPSQYCTAQGLIWMFYLQKMSFVRCSHRCCCMQRVSCRVRCIYIFS